MATKVMVKIATENFFTGYEIVNGFKVYDAETYRTSMQNQENGGHFDLETTVQDKFYIENFSVVGDRYEWDREFRHQAKQKFAERQNKSVEDFNWIN